MTGPQFIQPGQCCGLFDNADTAFGTADRVLMNTDEVCELALRYAEPEPEAPQVVRVPPRSQRLSVRPALFVVPPRLVVDVVVDGTPARLAVLQALGPG